MYTDLVIVGVFLICVLIFFRNFNSFVYGMVIIDIFFRILSFIQLRIGISELSGFFNKYCSSSIENLIVKYLGDGVLAEILLWGYVILYAFFLVYITKYFIKKRK